MRRSCDGDAWRLDGDKYYSTGTLYADWISVSAQRLNADGSSDRVIALVPAEAEGVERVDDWRGFGQRLSASGTTRFRHVRVKPSARAAICPSEMTILPGSSLPRLDTKL